jgi:hypothetical protein
MANYRAQARQFARQYGLNPGVFVRQIQQESGFIPGRVSPAGARGIAQFMPGTARGLGINPDNPTQALKGAAKLMAGYVHKYGSYRDALIAYNAGPGAIGRPLPAETQHYIATILGGSNPSPGGAQAGTQGTPGVRTTTSITSLAPGVDQQRRAALAQFVLAGPKADPLALAQNYAKLGQETQTTTRVTTTPGTPGTSASRHLQVLGCPAAPTPSGATARSSARPVSARTPRRSTSLAAQTTGSPRTRWTSASRSARPSTRSLTGCSATPARWGRVAASPGCART